MKRVDLDLLVLLLGSLLVGACLIHEVVWAKELSPAIPSAIVTSTTPSALSDIPVARDRRSNNGTNAPRGGRFQGSPIRELVAAHAKEACLLKLDDRMVARVEITPRGSVLNFPMRPSKVILGKKSSFGIEYVESDLAISPLDSQSRSNLFVYLEGRRFTFDLVTTLQGGCTTIFVRDSNERRFRVDPTAK
jgi:hypothetical protein